MLYYKQRELCFSYPKPLIQTNNLFARQLIYLFYFNKFWYKWPLHFFFFSFCFYNQASCSYMLSLKIGVQKKYGILSNSIKLWLTCRAWDMQERQFYQKLCIYFSGQFNFTTLLVNKWSGILIFNINLTNKANFTDESVTRPMVEIRLPCINIFLYEIQNAHHM